MIFSFITNILSRAFLLSKKDGEPGRLFVCLCLVAVKMDPDSVGSGESFNT